MSRNDDRIREIREIRFKTMKLGLLGSAETHRGTRWASNWSFAVREAWAGGFEFSEKRRSTRRPIIFHLRVPLEAIDKVLEARNQRLEAWGRSLELVIDTTNTCDDPGAVLRGFQAATHLFQSHLDPLELS
ncbi:hypothetical protein E3N88_45337 [Mikania micrantha]|uniref:Uncharacterized protein n=1 Tax=Mikania micrantha TaxID=192012 RepID=A0A5N6L9L7_9ASTR|nr:hypothetical protein E3N88_45337 [Mikania micrantha]